VPAFFLPINQDQASTFDPPQQQYLRAVSLNL